MTKLEKYGPLVLQITGRHSAASATADVGAFLALNAARVEPVNKRPREEVDAVRPARQGARWSSDEDSRLLQWHRMGCSVFDIAEAFARSPLGIHQRLVLHGLISPDAPWPGRTREEAAKRSARADHLSQSPVAVHLSQSPVAARADHLSQSPVAVKKDDSCAICMEKPRNQFFQPCGHVCCCASCAVGLSKCPMCRTRIDAKLKAFL